jgi:uncharacterized protein YlxW (UPF0749 family)
VGFSIVTQTKSAKGVNYYVSKKNISDLEISINTMQDEINVLNEKIKSVRQKYVDYMSKDSTPSKKDEYDAVLNDLMYYKILTASTPVQGPGVIIILDDSQDEIPNWADTNAYIVHDTDIMRIVSDLYKSGAEAITINGHRINSASTIYCNGYTVRINGEPEARPFIIKAIGDPANLSASMVSKSSYGNLLKDYYGLVFRVEVETNIEMPERPNKPVAYRYAHRVIERN